MKKLFKLAVSLFICAVTFLTGCTATSELALPSELVGSDVKTAYPDQFNMISPSFFMYTDAENSADEKEAWLEAMYDKYQVRLKILCDSDPAKDKTFGGAATVQRNNLLSDRKGTFNGIVEFSNYAQLQTAITNGTVLHLEGYLANNPTWNALPESVKMMFWTMRYALPASSSQTLKVRTFTNDSLEKTQTTVTDLESLKNYAINYKFLTGDYALSSDGLANLGDILNAFGLYQDESEFSPFGYDPAEGMYMDFLTKDAAVDALEYLRELYREGALKINFDGSPDTALSDFKNGICASYYGDYHEYDDCTNVLTLNPAYPKWICTNLSGYYLTYDTPQPQETVNMLVDMLYGSEDNYLDIITTKTIQFNYPILKAS